MRQWAQRMPYRPVAPRSCSGFVPCRNLKSKRHNHALRLWEGRESACHFGPHRLSVIENIWRLRIPVRESLPSSTSCQRVRIKPFMGLLVNKLHRFGYIACPDQSVVPTQRGWLCAPEPLVNAATAHEFLEDSRSKRCSFKNGVFRLPAP